MTDKEKLEAIRAEILRLVEVCGYDREMANDLLTFMDSLSIEPVSDFEMALVEMIDKSQKCVIEPWAVAAQWKDYLIELAKSEEPASENLKEEALVYSASDTITEDGKLVIDSEKVNAFKAGANWQKLKDMGITNKAQDVVANVLSSADNPLDAYATEVAFIMLPATLKESYHQTNRDRIGDAVKLGAKWQFERVNEALLSEVLPCFMHGGEADEVVAKLDEVLNKKNRTMSKAEERAQAAYPAWRNGIGDEFNSNSAYYGFIEGYSQAERDLELTWENIEEIYLLVIEIDNAYMEANAQNDYQYDVKEMYQDVLKRFKERKENAKVNV